jgi:PAS domain S-box-containing protein
MQKKLADQREELKHQLREASDFINAIKAGDHSVIPGAKIEGTEIASSLISLRNHLVELKESEGQRNWTNQGLTNFGDVVRMHEQKGLGELFDKVISFLVNYLQANQGGVFVLRDAGGSDEHLYLMSCYAYQKKRFNERRIEIGENLVGQCFLEGEIIYMTNVPGDYVKITSGLGEALPRNVLLAPMVVDKKVVGVLELASFNLFESYKIEFIKKIVESLAATYANLISAERTKQLLAESREQAEQLRSQEEEMRQNLEELAATQEEIGRRQVESENRIKAVNESGIASIEFDLEGRVLAANHTFLTMMEYTMDDILGRHHRIFVDREEAASESYKKFWQDLANGVDRPGEYRRLTRTGKEIFIRGSYSIIFDQNGKPSRVLKLATDVTALRKQQKQTEELLHSSQQLVEEMKAQEEELRQNMEELSATQDEITRRQVESENRINAINESGIASIEFDLDGVIVAANDTFLKLMEYTSDEVIGKHHRMFVKKEEASSAAYAQFWKDLRLGVARPGEYVRISKSGKEIYIRGSYSIIRDEKGQPARVLKLATDVTALHEQQKRTEELLRLSQEHAEEVKAQEEELRQNMEELATTQEEIARRQMESENRIKAINESGVASIEFNLDGIIVDANDSFLKMMGYSIDEVIGKHHSIFVSKEEVASDSYAQFWKDLSNGVARPGEYKRITKTGEEVFIKGSYSILFDHNSKPSRVLKLATDVTALRMQQQRAEELLRLSQENIEEVKAQEEELRQNMEELSATQEEIVKRQIESENRLRALDESGIALVEFDMQGLVESANESFLSLFGYSFEEVQGKYHRMFVDEAYALSPKYEAFWKGLRNGVAKPGEFERITKHGDKIVIRGSYSLIRDSKGQPIKVIKLAYPIANQQRGNRKM